MTAAFPSPRPSPLGRGRIIRSPFELRESAAVSQSHKVSQIVRLLFPLPLGEGQGEGKGDIQ
jgi:hypothetical protein